MTGDWGINDGDRDWHRPSVDFVFCDRRGGLWAMEIKITVKSPRDILSVLCQVTHRAIGLTSAYSYERLALAFHETRSGIHGRWCGELRDDFRRMHQSFFDLRLPLPKDRFGRGEMRRVVGAVDFSRQWYPMLRSFNHSDPQRFVQRLKRDYEIKTDSNKELRRFAELPLESRTALAEPVLYLDLTDSLDCCRRRSIRA